MDVAGMAERISSAASAPPAAAPATETPSIPALPSTPAATAPEPPAPTATSAAVTPQPAADLQFEDDPPELNFDNDQPEPEAPPPIPEAAKTEGESFDGLLPKQVEDAFMRTNRGRHLLQTYKTIRELRAEPQVDDNGQNVGGLGFIPNADQIRQFHQAHSDVQAMEHEFSANPESFVTNWIAPDAQGNFRDGADQVLANIPSVLDKVYNLAEQNNNPAMKEKAVGMFRSIFQPMAVSYLNGLKERARAIDSKEEREYYLNAVRAIEFDLTGKYSKDDELAPPKPEDAIARQWQQIEEEKSRIHAWQTRQSTEAQKAVENQIFSTIDQNLLADCEKALAPVKAGMSPRAFRAAVNDFKAEITSAVRKNQDGWRDYNFKLTAARSSRGADARTAPVQVFRQMSRNAIQARYRTVLQELANGAVAQNGQLHETAAAASAQRAPAVNGGQSPPQSVIAGAKLTRNPGEDPVDFNRRRIAASLGAPN